MERIITYDELPVSNGQSIYLRDETDPKLQVSLVAKGYNIVDNIKYADDTTIFVTGRRQAYFSKTMEEYKRNVDMSIRDDLRQDGIVKPMTNKLSLVDLYEHRYKLPFVLKNENQNGGREKFLIKTEEDYENLLLALDVLFDKKLRFLFPFAPTDPRSRINYDQYIGLNFYVQEYVETPTEYNTTVRLLTSSSNDLLYAALKYKKPEVLKDYTTLLGYLLSEIYPLSTKSIVSNTLSGGSNLLLGERSYNDFESRLLNSHGINSEQFAKLIKATREVHERYRRELGIICGFDYIYDREKEKWFLLEYHSRPMVGDYSKRQGLIYGDKDSRKEADGRVRATALALTLKKGK